jgi:hypothetical protein
MNVASMQIRALAHRDAIAFNIMKQVPDSEASKKWSSVKAEQFVREMKEEAEKKRRSGVPKEEKNY